MSADRYELIRKLGSGNFTEGVWLARHKDMDREFAVKLLKIEPGSGRDSLLQEAKLMAALDRHDHVVEVFDAGDWDADRVYIASEVCADGSLDALAGGEVDPATACRVMSEACRGLVHMHAKDLLHLDLRPANILLQGATPKVADFGLSQWSRSAAVAQVYTPHASPELLDGHIGTKASDQYAMAMTMAHLLTAGGICTNAPLDQVNASRTGKWPDLSLIGDHVPAKVTKLIKRATAYNPDKRFPTIGDLEQAIDLASPAVSFRSVDQVTMESTDGVWKVHWSSKGAAHTIEVFRNGRRVTAKGAYNVTEQEAAPHRRRVVTSMAKP